jgi:hypothetical protein
VIDRRDGDGRGMKLGTDLRKLANAARRGSRPQCGAEAGADAPRGGAFPKKVSQGPGFNA